MKLAFVLFRYFPYGGLERDMLAMAELCRQRGHDVTLYTRSWQGPRPELPVVELPVGGWTNHGRNQAFVERFQQHLAREGQPDRVVGFNKMPGLDFYYAADVCFADKVYRQRGLWYRFTPRARSYLQQEAAVFGVTSTTRILMISRPQMDVYRRHYGTPLERMQLLPPGIRRDRVLPEGDPALRARLRARYGLGEEQRLLLMVGSDFARKGLDRSIRALAALPGPWRERTVLWVAGQDEPGRFVRLARRLGVANRLRMLGGRDDVSELLWAADALLHPAYSENTGTALLEGMVAGLPVLASSVCGYAHYIDEYGLGRVLPEPVDPAALAGALVEVLSTPREHWLERQQQLVQSDVFSMTERAAGLIEGASSPC